jgi:amidase
MEQDLYYTADGGEDIKRDMAAGGEPYVPHVEALVNRGKAISVWQYWQLNREKRAAQRAYLKKWQSIRGPNNQAVDVLLMPVMPHAAVKHRHCKWVGYTKVSTFQFSHWALVCLHIDKVWNLLDYTSLVLPGGLVDKNIDPANTSPSVADYQPRNDLDKWNWELYDPEVMHGMPVGLQIVGRRLEEEKVLSAGKVIVGVLRMLQ